MSNIILHFPNEGTYRQMYFGSTPIMDRKTIAFATELKDGSWIVLQQKNVDAYYLDLRNDIKNNDFIKLKHP